MTNTKFLKIWSGIISSFALLHTEAAAHIQSFNTETENPKTHITVQKDSRPDLFLQQAISDYSEVMQFAGHRSHRSHSSHRSHYSGHSSHSSHSSHYSSSTYSTPAPTSPPATTPPSPATSPSASPKGVYQYQNRKATKDSTRTKQGTYVPSATHKIDSTSIKIVQVALNLLGYNAGKVDGKMGQATRQAIRNFQASKKIDVTGQINGQTCLNLARTVQNKLPNNQSIKKVHDNLISTYIRISTK